MAKNSFGDTSIDGEPLDFRSFLAQGYESLLWGNESFETTKTARSKGTKRRGYHYSRAGKTYMGLC